MPVNVIDPIVSTQEAILKAVKASQQRTVAATQAVSNLVAPVASKLPKSPLAGVLPEPSALIDTQLAFVAELVAAQRDYTHELAEALSPSKSSSDV